MEDLLACRDALLDIRRHNQTLEALRALDERADPRQALGQAEKDLRTARLSYLRSLGRSVEAMAGMPEGPRAVLWQAFVLGKSNTQIGDSLGYARRSVVRLKKCGLDWLERQAGAEDCVGEELA